jgi:hypothetical protein
MGTVKGAETIGNPAKNQFLQTFCGNCRKPGDFFADIPVSEQKKQIVPCIPVCNEKW